LIRKHVTDQRPPPQTHTPTRAVQGVCPVMHADRLSKVIGNQFMLCAVCEGRSTFILDFELSLQVRLMVGSADELRSVLVEVRDGKT
jgi:hypothetical protein